MKTFLSVLAIIILMVFARPFSGAEKRSRLLQPIPQQLKKDRPGIDTFYAVKTIFQQGGKTIAKDTVVFIMHEIPTSYPKARAGINLSIEPIPYDALDTTNPVLVRYDTVVWTYKPYKPK